MIHYKSWENERDRVKRLNYYYENVRLKCSRRKNPWAAEKRASKVIYNIIKKVNK